MDYFFPLKLFIRLRFISAENFNFVCLFSLISPEHGGHHGHSHGITRSNNKLTHMANTDDNENNSFVFTEKVNSANLTQDSLQ